MSLATTTTTSFSFESHAVSRSSELLSCARTALKILKSNHNSNHNSNNASQSSPWWISVDPSQLHLHQENKNNNKNSHYHQESQPRVWQQEGLELLQSMQTSLLRLEGLVRRRGHVNDPTQEISIQVKHLELDAKELNQIVTLLQQLPTTTKAARLHWNYVASWLQQVASQQTKALKEVLKVRGNVLAEQAQRRKLLNPSTTTTPTKSNQAQPGTTKLNNNNGSSKSTNGSSTSSTPWDSPLFTMTTTTATKQKKQPPPPSRPSTTTTTTTTSNTSSNAKSASSRIVHHDSAPPLYGSGGGASTSYYSGGYGGGGYGGGGYGGGYGNATRSSTGMRQRKTTNNNNHKDDDNDDDTVEQMQAQIQLRQEDRQSRHRLEHARMAERSLADLGTLFGKMSQLIHSQAETLEHIEDDVERAALDVHAGHEEINTLHGIKKGNRALILKVFGILIFFIIFMRLY